MGTQDNLPDPQAMATTRLTAIPPAASGGRQPPLMSVDCAAAARSDEFQLFETRWNWLTGVLGLSAIYVATAKLGFLLAIHPGNVTAVWPPSGIALAALLIGGNRLWPGIWLGSFLANTLVFKGFDVVPADFVTPTFTKATLRCDSFSLLTPTAVTRNVDGHL